MKRLLVGISAAAVLLLGNPASAQSDRGTARIPVVLALVDDIPGSGPRFRIVPAAGESAREVILLSADATPDLLTEAVETFRLVHAQSQHGAGAARSESAVLRRVPSGAHRPSHGALPWADRVLRDLRNAAPRNVPGAGHVRTLQIWLAPQPAGRTRP